MPVKTRSSLNSTLFLLIACCTGQAQVNHMNGAPLAGDYTVGTNGDYLTLEEAITKINEHGIAATVTLQIKNGTYQTHVSIGDFVRTGQADDWLIITSKNSQNPAVLQHDAQSGADNWVIQLDEASHVVISSLVLEATGTAELNNIITLENQSSHIEINNNQFNSYSVDMFSDFAQTASINSAESSSALNHINILGNEFNNGRSAVRMKGASNDNIMTVMVEKNTFNEQFLAVEMILVNDLSFDSNVINSEVFNSSGMRFFNVNRGQISGNKIAMSGNGNSTKAISIARTNETADDVVIIKNNFITSSNQAIRIGTPLSRNINVFHNTIVIDNASNFNTRPTALEVISNPNPVFMSENIKIRNNIIINNEDSDNAYLMKFEDSTGITESEGNLFFGVTDNQFEVDGIDYVDLSAYQLATTLDTTSIAKNVEFIDVDQGDLHLTIAQYADPDLVTMTIPAVNRDIDGDIRQNPSTLRGADELPAIDPIFKSSFETTSAGRS